MREVTLQVFDLAQGGARYFLLHPDTFREVCMDALGRADVATLMIPVLPRLPFLQGVPWEASKVEMTMHAAAVRPDVHTRPNEIRAFNAVGQTWNGERWV